MDPFNPGVLPPRVTRDAYLFEVERIARNPVQTSVLWTTVGCLTLPLGEVRMAEFAFRRALILRRFNLPARLGLAKCCLAREDWAGAASYAQYVRFFRPDVKEADEVLDLIERSRYSVTNQALPRHGGGGMR